MSVRFFPAECTKRHISIYIDISLMYHLRSTFENETKFKALVSIYLLLNHFTLIVPFAFE